MESTNANPVTIDYYFNTAEISLSLLLIYALGIGILLGFFATFFSILRLKNENRKLKNRIKKADSALQDKSKNTLEAANKE